MMQLQGSSCGAYLYEQGPVCYLCSHRIRGQPQVPEWRQRLRAKGSPPDRAMHPCHRGAGLNLCLPKVYPSVQEIAHVLLQSTSSSSQVLFVPFVAKALPVLTWHAVSWGCVRLSESN